MDDIQGTFTNRMLRRVSSRKARDRILDCSNEDLQRRYNILKAIDDPPTQHGASANYQKFSKIDDDSFSNHSNWTRKSGLNNNDDSFNSSYKKYERNIEVLSTSPTEYFGDRMKPFELSNIKSQGKDSYKQIDESDRDLFLTDSANRKETPTQLLKVREGHIEMPSKMIAELKSIRKEENVENLPYFDQNEIHDLTQSSMSLAGAIDDLDEQIKNLEMQIPIEITTKAIVENPKNIYPVLEDVKFVPTGFTLEKGFCSKQTKRNEDNLDVIEISRSSETFTKNDRSDDNGLLYHETPRTARKTPMMESTRKSIHSDSTKIKFPTPTRIDPNSISTIGIPVTSEGRSACRYDDNIEEIDNGGDCLNDTMPYDIDRFLEDALGDELYNTTATYATSEQRDRTNSRFTASELISEDRTPLHKRVIQAIKSPMTEPTPKDSSTLNRSIGMYRSLSQRIKKKFRSALKTKEEYLPADPMLPWVTHETDRIHELLQEVNVQQTLMNQAAKALTLCRAMKEFVDSSERIESERLLLLSTLRRKSVVEEMKRITADERKCDDNFHGERSEITISDISLNLREYRQRETQNEDTVEWFVVVVSQGIKVWCTRAISSSKKHTRVYFPGLISIPDLTPSFKILVEVYSLRLRRSTYNHEDKYKIRNRQKRSTSCPPCPTILASPTKLLKHVERPLSPKIHYGNQISKTKNTSFILSGFVELFLEDLSLSSPWPLILVPANSSLQGTINLNLACRLHLSISHEGFLNHGDEAGGFAIWNRRWCVLKGHTLMFWNYPREQETKEPITTVELINCVSKNITTVDRTICAKPRTLLIETVRRKSENDRNSMIVECRTACTIVRNLISFDSVHELMEWSTKLNHVIMALREWNVIEARTKPQVTNL